MSSFLTVFYRLAPVMTFLCTTFLNASALTPLEAFDQRLAHFKGAPCQEDAHALFSCAKDLLMAFMEDRGTLFGAHEEGIVSYERALYDAQDQELASLLGQKPGKIRKIYQRACLEEKGGALHAPPSRSSCPLCAVTRELVWQEHKALLKTLVQDYFGRLIWDELDHFDAIDDVPYTFLQQFKNLTNAQKTDFLRAPYNIQAAFACLGEVSSGNHQHKKKMKRTFENARTRLGTFFEGRKATLMGAPDYAPFTRAWRHLEACERVVDLVGDFYAEVETHMSCDPVLSPRLLESWDGATRAPFPHTKGCPNIQPATLEDVQEASSSEPGPQGEAMEILRLMDQVMKDAFVLVRISMKSSPLSAALEESSGDAPPDDPLPEGP